MSTEAPKNERRAKHRDSPSTENTNNPFDTVFDGEESDGEWWDEEESNFPDPNQPAAEARITQWPRTLESANAGTSTKNPSRTAIRKVDKRYSVHKPIRDKSKGRQRKQNALAGIKVITNFSKPSAATKVSPTKASQPTQVQPSKTMPQMGYFVDLAALQALNGEAPQASGGFWKSKKNKEFTQAAASMPSLAGEASQTTTSGELADNPPGRLKPRAHIPSPLDLSPSDRPIVIGISIPSARLAEHTLSPETATSTTSKILQSYEHRTPTSMAPETPTIIITPAQAGTIWSALDDNSAGPTLRPASSIYSQAPHNAMGIYTQKDAPPVPQMPASVLENERQRIAAQKSYFSPDSDEGTTWEDDEVTDRDIKSRSRAFSTGTVFEEDESPVIARRGRATSISAGPKDLKHASISTVTTRRRSKGWWNYITTPFLTRSNTVATQGVFEDRQPPALPSLTIAAEKAQEAERDGKMWEKQFSPLTPATTTTISSEAWCDTLAKEDQSKHPKAADQSPDVYESRHKVQTSTGTLPFVLSEVALMGGSTTSSLPTVNTDPQLNRSVSERSVTNSREVRISSDGTDSRGPQNNNPFVQPRLADLNNPSSAVQSTRQQVPQPIRPALARSQASVLPSPPPPYSPAGSQIPRYRAVLPPNHVQNLQYPVSPGPLSPGLQQAMSTGGGIPMSEVPLTHANRQPINLNSEYSELPPRQAPMIFDPPPLQPLSSKAQKKAEAKRQRHEKEDAVARKAGGWWRGRGCISDRGCYGRSGPEGRKKRRWYFGLIVGFSIMMIVVITLATTLHRESNTVVGPSQWLNLTGFPPIFTGLSTIASPVNLETNTGCVFPATQWSCDLPKEQQASVTPNPSNQPNFLLQIQWDNSSAANATFSNVTGNPKLGTRALVGNPVSAGQFIKSLLIKTRQIVTFAPNPAPPSFAEEYFLGNTTDGIVSTNKAGEPTPFYISFLPPTESSFTKRLLLTRDSTNQFPNISDAIPPPSLNKDDTAQAANLLPLPFQQPVRLYDRGLPSEHYGFYSYFDRSIFLKSITPLNQTNLGDGAVPDDENGGSTEEEAGFRCTWAETRFLVQMWTRMNSTAQLLNSTSSSPPASGSNFTQPGTFPYPVTITLDRHGGDATRKMLYCYEMDTREGIVSSGKHLVGENRAFGGIIINPAAQIFQNESDPSLGGFDGGTGGCSCRWSNFLNVN
jgi:hypothetical protein